MKLQFWEHQVRNIIYCASRNYAAIFDDPALGKTVTGIGLFLLLRDRGVVKNMLVVGTKSIVTEQWPKEIAKWDDFKGLRVTVLDGEAKHRKAVLPAEITLINADGLRWLAEHPVQYDMIIVDESTFFSNAMAIRTRVLQGLMQQTTRRYIMSGTAVSEGVEALYSQIKLLDDGLALGRTQSAFYYKYMLKSGPHTFVARKGAMDEVMRLIASFTTRTSAEDANIPLPPLVDDSTTEIHLDLPPEAERLYGEMYEHRVVQTPKGQTITAVNPGVRDVYLRQIANGALYTPDGGTWHVHSAKTDATIKKMREVWAAGKKCLLITSLDSDIERLELALGRKLARVTGGVSTAKRVAAIRKWNAGELTELVLHPKSAAHGLNLQGVPADVLFVSGYYSEEGDSQAIKRVHRPGQTQGVNVWRFLMRRTVDIKINKIVDAKSQAQKDAFTMLKQHQQETQGSLDAIDEAVQEIKAEAE